MKSRIVSRVTSTLYLGFIIGASPAAAATPAPVVSPPYALSIFAQSENGYTDPDSVTFNDNNIFVGYGNGGAPDGSGGAMSTIVEYDMSGAVVTTFTVAGHNDGLRINPADGSLWAIQNEDANANVTVIDLKHGKQTTTLFPSPAPHGGGYDDVVFTKGATFVSASNPTSNPNTGPAIVSADLDGKLLKVTPVLAGQASATNVLTGSTVTLNLLDPDSMILDPFGELMLDSQGDGEEIIVHFPGQSCQSALVVPLTYPTGADTFAGLMADDTAFATSNSGFIIFADKDLQTVYKITTPYFFIGAAFTAFQDNTGTLGFVGRTDFSTGVSTPIVSGLGNPAGMAFIPSSIGKISVPEIPKCPK
jgi:hypothetical protein